MPNEDNVKKSCPFLNLEIGQDFLDIQHKYYQGRRAGKGPKTKDIKNAKNIKGTKNI